MYTAAAKANFVVSLRTIVCLITTLIVASASAQTFLFDFGSAGTTTVRGASPDDPVNYWNNIPESVGTVSNGMLTNIVSTANDPSTLGFAIINRFNGANGNGTTNSTVFAADATRDSLYGNTGLFNNATNIFPSFKLTGLDPGTVYDFTFYASRTSVGDNRETGYTLAGANNGFGALNAANNVDNVATVNGIQPTAAGEITVSIAPTANNNNSPTFFTYLGVMKVAATPPQTPIGFTLEPITTRAVELSEVTFRAAVTGATPHFVQWFSNGVPIAGANQFTYTIPSVTLDMNGSLFSVNVSNFAFSATSSNAMLRVVNDIVPPELLSVSTVDGLTVNVCFNEALNQNSAEEEFYYYVNTDLFPISAVLDTNGRCVTLTFDQKITGAFSLWVEYVTDLSGNPITLTNVTGQVPDAESQMVLIDFGGGAITQVGAAPADDPVRTWNNVTGTIGQSDTGILSPLVTTQNIATAISLSMVRRFNGINENGTTLATAPYPTDATRDSLFGNTETFSGLANIFPSFKLTGLNPARGYDLTFFASRTGVTDNRETQYSIEGVSSNAIFLNAANNVTNTVTITGVIPSAAGEIQVSLWPGPNNNNGSHFTYLGVLAIVPQSASTQPKFLMPTLSGGNINLQWSGNGELQSAPTVLGPWSIITPSGANSHSEPVDLSTNRFFRIEQ